MYVHQQCEESQGGSTFAQLLDKMIGDLFQLCCVNGEDLFKMLDLGKKIFRDIGKRSYETTLDSTGMTWILFS